MARALWIADTCRKFGLDVVEVDGWRTRGSESFNPHGVVCHHTAGAKTGDMPSLRILINGREGLPGPLCNVGLSRSGRVYVIAAGRANHAGSGGYRGMVGNSSVLGIEAENDGYQPWPEVQMRAYSRLASALISRAVGGDKLNTCAHKEWAPSRKFDPHHVDMNAFRAGLNVNPTPAPTPSDPMEDEVLDQIKSNATGTTIYLTNWVDTRPATSIARLEDLIRRGKVNPTTMTVSDDEMRKLLEQ